MARKTTSLPSRDLVQLAHEYKPHHDIGGWWLSEKLDGHRMWWDGGATRGLPVREVPFANILKEDRHVDDHVCTGLWSRWGHPIFAPDWWIDKLPNFMLDGEVWLGRGLWNQTASVVKKLAKNRDDNDWVDMKFKVFDTPPLTQVMMIGEINSVNFVKIMSADIASWFNAKFTERGCRPVSKRQFESQLKWLQIYLPPNEVVSLHEQVKLPMQEAAAKVEVRNQLEHYTSQGAEGIVLRAPQDVWTPVRSKLMLKVKECQDDEAEVIGYTSAEFGETGAKLGLIGALCVKWEGKEFKIGTGFTDEERQFGNAESTRWAKLMPGEKAPPHIISKHFPRGSMVTFKFRELSPDGIPKEARYLRKPSTTH